MTRTIAVFLDGYAPDLEADLRAAGELPALAALHASGASWDLDHGDARLSGLAGEHVATGLGPDAARRWSAVSFDPERYVADQVGTDLPPFTTEVDLATVVVDVPYLDLARGGASVRGIQNWGAHDPGVPSGGVPAGLFAEVVAHVGAYPAVSHIYGIPWASVDACERAGAALAEGVDRRADLAEWLLGERLPDWDLALVAVSETHSAIESLWHGIDPDHPLAMHESAPTAGAGVRSVYRAVDRLVGRLRVRFPDAHFAVFSLHGMGTNGSDAATMVLLPELLHRAAGGSPRLAPPTSWTADPSVPAPLDPGRSWTAAVGDVYADEAPRPRAYRPTTTPSPPLALRAVRKGGRLVASAPGSLDGRLARTVRRIGSALDGLGRWHRVDADPDVDDPPRTRMPWMPASWYARDWPAMPAFALPSFYDGRIRVNLRGREARGSVARADYDAVLDDLVALAEACIDPVDGEPAVARCERVAANRGVDPTELGASECDLVVHWRGTPMCLDHPLHGRIGPVPWRRTGGHTGRLGELVIVGDGSLGTGRLGVRDALDVVPTLLTLAGATPPSHLSGRSILDPARS